MALTRTIRAYDESDGKIYDVVFTDATAGTALNNATKAMEIVRDTILAHSSNNFSADDAFGIGGRVAELMLREGIVST
jgi:hypothetical protein